MNPHLIVSVVGTRPEAIKMAPVLRAIARRPGLRQRLLLTGQHPALGGEFGFLASDEVEELGLATPGSSPEAMREAFRVALRDRLAALPAALVLVQGDTNSALAGALAARDRGLPVGHVEAGLRSHDLAQPWPEEGNRIAIDHVADLLFAPTELAAANLRAEPDARGAILVTGNSGIDALLAARSPERARRHGGGRRRILVTFHRKENFNRIAAICDGLKRVADSLPVELVAPLHPNPHVRRAVVEGLAGHPNIALIEPLAHREAVALADSCWAILTDSGGLQEEGAALGVPVLVLRNVTERGEAAANLMLVGTEPERIVKAVTALLGDEVRHARMSVPSLAFGDGHAAPRIADAVEAFVTGTAAPAGLAPAAAFRKKGAMDWSPTSWREHEARQLPVYPDPSALNSVTRELSAYPSLIEPKEANSLQAAIAEAQAGRAFLLQGGDCAESFAEFSPGNIRASFALIAEVARMLNAASGLPVIRVGRMAGQFAKPRSTDPERKGDDALPAYRGDIINGIAFDAVARVPDPERMFRAYSQAAATLSHLRALANVEGSPFYTSHEALLLPFEEALAQTGPDGLCYATSAHLLWVGDRTRFPGSAHVEFARGIANPLGLKVGPTLEPDMLLRLLDILNPGRTAGRMTLIARLGAGSVERLLPPLIRAVAREGHPVLWSCDPMHGNTIKAASGYKTRPFDSILAETERFFAIIRAETVKGAGIHVEMTGQDVTECTGGEARLTDGDLGDRYRTHCDPRLNAGQAMELAALLAEQLRPKAGSRAA